MSLAIAITTLQPQLRSEIVLGPPILSRGTSVHYMKDGITNCFYRIGTKEYFLISRMDGNRSLQQIGAEYETYAGKRLSSNAWTELLKLLEKRQLLVGSTTLTGLRDLRKAAQKKGRKERGFFRARIALVNPDAFLERILPGLRFAFHPFFVCLALAAIAILEVFFFSHLNRLVSDAVAAFRAGTMTHGWFLFALILLVIMVLVTHEFAHGLACKRFGGSVHEIGIGWRYLSPFPYCKLDDVVLFQNRWHRVYAAFAGVFINLLMLIPFVLLWHFAPEQHTLRVFSAYVLLAGNFLCLLNLLPFIELDGYLMVTYALNMADLHKDAYALLGSKVKHLLVKRTVPLKYTQRSSFYLIYGAFSFIITAFVMGYMAINWFDLLRLRVGNLVAGLICLTLALLFLLLKGPGKDWMQKTRRMVLASKQRHTSVV